MHIFHWIWNNIFKTPFFPWDFIICSFIYFETNFSLFYFAFWILSKLKFKTSKQAISTAITFAWFWSKPWKFLVPPRNNEPVQVSFEIQLWGADLPIWFARIPLSSPDLRASPQNKALLQLEDVHATQSPSPLCGGAPMFCCQPLVYQSSPSSESSFFPCLEDQGFLAIHSLAVFAWRDPPTALLSSEGRPIFSYSLMVAWVNLCLVSWGLEGPIHHSNSVSDHTPLANKQKIRISFFRKVPAWSCCHLPGGMPSRQACR